MKSAIVALIGVAGLASASLGQAGFNIHVIYAAGHTSVNPNAPTCRVRVEAKFSPNDYAVAGVRFDVLAGEAGWSNNVVLAPLTTGSNPGVINGAAVTGVTAGQLNFPAAGIFANPANPIGAWEANWTTANFTSRVVPVNTRTARFDVYADRNSPTSGSRMPVMEGGNGIVVTPAPSALALLGLGGLVAGRRRR